MQKHYGGPRLASHAPSSPFCLRESTDPSPIGSGESALSLPG